MKSFELFTNSLKLAGIFMALIATRFGTQTTLTTFANEYCIEGKAEVKTKHEIYVFCDGVRALFEMEAK